MIHIMDGKWQLKNMPNLYIEIPEVISYINYKKIKPQSIPIKDIAYKDLANIDVQGARFIMANQHFAGIVVENMENPYDKKYRLIDGRHRLLKTIQDNDKHFMAYVLQPSDARKFYKVLYGY